MCAWHICQELQHEVTIEDFLNLYFIKTISSVQNTCTTTVEVSTKNSHVPSRSAFRDLHMSEHLSLVC